MLSRVAERVYWQARYLERAENTARLLDVFTNLLLDLPPKTRLGWGTLVDIAGTEEAFAERYKQANERNVVRFLFSENNGVSILDMLAATRENARTTREIMPTEAFEHINNLYYRAKDKAAKSISKGDHNKLLEDIINQCQLISGLLAGTMSRTVAYSFVRLGRSLERADMTTRIVDAGSRNLIPAISESGDEDGGGPFENILWMNILRSQSAYQMYRQHVKHRIRGEDVVIFLLKDRQFPRSTTHNLETMSKVLVNLPNATRARSQVDKVHGLLQRAKIAKLLEQGLPEFIDRVQVELGKIHGTIADTWFLPNK